MMYGDYLMMAMVLVTFMMVAMVLILVMVVKLVMVVDPMLEEVGRPMAICQKADAASDAWST